MPVVVLTSMHRQNPRASCTCDFLDTECGDVMATTVGCSNTDQTHNREELWGISMPVVVLTSRSQNDDFSFKGSPMGCSSYLSTSVNSCCLCSSDLSCSSSCLRLNSGRFNPAALECADSAVLHAVSFLPLPLWSVSSAESAALPEAWDESCDES